MIVSHTGLKKKRNWSFAKYNKIVREKKERKKERLPKIFSDITVNGQSKPLVKYYKAQKDEDKLSEKQN